MGSNSGANVILGAWRSIYSNAGYALARFRGIRCNECLRLMHCWNRRVWSADGDCCAHLQCWEGQLFLKALVTNQIRYAQIKANENSALSGNHSVEDKAPELDASATLEEQHRIILRDPVEELPVQTGVDESQRNGNLTLRQLRQRRWHLTARSAARPLPPPPRHCAVCGAVEFSEKSTFCSKCGSSLTT
jgi:hypothetical protein